MLISILDLDKVSVDEDYGARTGSSGIDINDEWKSILRQLTHSPHGRIVLYRDSLDDAIGMLRVRETHRLMIETGIHQSKCLSRPLIKFTLYPDRHH